MRLALKTNHVIAPGRFLRWRITRGARGTELPQVLLEGVVCPRRTAYDLLAMPTFFTYGAESIVAIFADRKAVGH